jgi:hypothetical protein
MKRLLERPGDLAEIMRRAVRSDAVVSLALATAYFQVVWGLSAVDPTNLDWVFAVERDMTRALTSITYFRTSSWSFPITAFDSILHPIGTNIANGDGIPCLAVLYKLIDPLLDERVYQYFGLWLFACVWLQAFLAKRILSAFGLPTTVQWLGVLLATADLPQALALWHATLWGHWTFLAGFLLVLAREFPLKRMLALVFIVPWTHPYLLAMVLPTVVAAFVQHRRTSRLASKAALVVATLLVSCYLVGYFHFPTGEAERGRYQADVLSPFNSAGTGLVPAIFPLREYDEGYAYLGLGGLALLALLLVGALVPRWRVPKLHVWPLLIVCLLMGLYAFSTSPRIFGHELGPIPVLSDLLRPVEARLRCNGRFLWPLWQYVVLFGVRNAWEMTRGGRRALAAVGGIVALQVADVGPWLADPIRPIPDAPAIVRVPSKIKAGLNERTKLLVFVPPVLRMHCGKRDVWGNRAGEYWGPALFGAVHGLKTNSDFFALGRVSSEDSDIVCELTEKMWRRRKEHPEALFIRPSAVDARKAIERARRRGRREREID